MNFDEISRIDDDMMRNEELYKFFDEEKRLTTKAGQVEKITTQREIDMLTHENSKVLDVGAGTGVYTIPLSENISEVVAYEPSITNYSILSSKLKKANIQNVKAYNLSSLEMGNLPSDYFDLVLLFGPMYHLSDEKDRTYTIDQAKRVLKKDGHILISFINHDMIPITETSYNENFFEGKAYIPEEGRLINRPFIFFTLDECVKMIEDRGLMIKKKIATDGFSEILKKQIEEMSEISRKNYLDRHLAHCEKEELLGATNHFLFVCSLA